MQLQSVTPETKENSPVQSAQLLLVNQLAEQLSLEAKNIDVSEPLTRYGLDSIDAVTMVGDLEDLLELELPSTLFWDHPTIEKSVQFLADNYDLAEALANVETDETPAVQDAPTEKAAASDQGKGWGNLWGKFTGS